MFGMGFGEIVLIALIAVIFLGPDKLPETIVNIAKFLRSIKQNVAEAKDALESELEIGELKKEALDYQKSMSKEGRKHYDQSAREVKALFPDLSEEIRNESKNVDRKSE